MSKNNDIDPTRTSDLDLMYRHDLSAEEYQSIEAALSRMVYRQFGETVCTVWMRSDNQFADAIRTAESDIFPDVPEI